MIMFGIGRMLVADKRGLKASGTVDITRKITCIKTAFGGVLADKNSIYTFGGKFQQVVDGMRGLEQALTWTSQQTEKQMEHPLSPDISDKITKKRINQKNCLWRRHRRHTNSI